MIKAFYQKYDSDKEVLKLTTVSNVFEHVQ